MVAYMVDNIAADEENAVFLNGMLELLDCGEIEHTGFIQ